MAWKVSPLCPAFLPMRSSRHESEFVIVQLCIKREALLFIFPLHRVPTPVRFLTSSPLDTTRGPAARH